MFTNLTKFIQNQMDPSKGLARVKSIADNEHFRPLCLLRIKRKSKRSYRSAPYYEWTGFTLDHVLKPGKEGKQIEPIYQVSSQVTVRKTSTNKADGSVRVACDPASVEVKGAASSSNEYSITVHKKSVSRQSLEELREKREINMDHSFIRQLQRKNIELYLVIETLEASEEAVYRESSKADGGFMAKLYAKFSAQGTRENNQSIDIPKGCTLAFRTTELHIRDGAWDLGYFSEMRSLTVSTSSRVTIVQNGEAYVSLGQLVLVVREVENRCQIFFKSSPNLLHILLNTIKAVMRDKNLLQELSQKMEEVPEQKDGYELKTESPDLQALFSSLQHFPRDRLLLLAEGITYVLDALQELMEDQLLLLLESLERKIVSQQLKLVVNLLKHDLEQQMQPFHVDAGLLSFPHEDEQMLTIALVELSGVQLLKDGSALPRDQPFEAVAALFVALYTLNLLSAFDWNYLALPREASCKILGNLC